LSAEKKSCIFSHCKGESIGEVKEKALVAWAMPSLQKKAKLLLDYEKIPIFRLFPENPSPINRNKCRKQKGSFD